MKKLLHFLILLISFWATAQNEALFNEATEAYNQGDYEKAIANYLQIEKNGKHSVSLYYNLGNAYYKLNKVAPSIYYYEKALLLKPNDPEIKNNLAYSQNMALDAIEELPETGISRIYRQITTYLTFDQWAYTAIVFMILFVFSYIAFYYFKYATQKRIAFITSIVSLGVVALTIVIAYLQYRDFKADQPAIVFSEEVTVRSEPNNRTPEIFKLHEGAKVFVLEQLNDWNKIQLTDGKTGWIPTESIKLLKNF